VLSYVVGTLAVYGFAARNGRTQADNAPEAMLSLVTKHRGALGAQSVHHSGPAQRYLPLRHASLIVGRAPGSCR
jgi:hypothetical protein